MRVRRFDPLDRNVGFPLLAVCVSGLVSGRGMLVVQQTENGISQMQTVQGAAPDCVSC